VLEDTFRAKCLRVIFTEKLDLFAWMGCTVCNRAFHCRVAVVVCGNLLYSLSKHWQTSKDLVIYGKVLWCDLVRRFVVRTRYRLVFLHFLAALETKTVTAWQRKRLFILVVVRLEADTAFKY
jgi:hypothetical protein